MRSSEQARGAFLQQTGDPFAARASSDAGAGTRGADDETAFATSLNRITGKRTNGERLRDPRTGFASGRFFTRRAGRNIATATH